MKITAASTTRIFGAPTESGDSTAARVYRTSKSFAVVHFEPAGRGRIVFLPERAELRAIGSSCLCECCEVLCEDPLYHIFKADLLGPWSSPIKSSRIELIPERTDEAFCA